jgi:tRNA (cmo5U34)-methyltransferase
MWKQYGEYLSDLGGDDYRDRVFMYIEQEDTPRSLQFQLDSLRAAGFRRSDVLHKHGPFAAFGAMK